MTILVRDTLTNKQGEAWQWLQDIWKQSVMPTTLSNKKADRGCTLQYERTCYSTFVGQRSYPKKNHQDQLVLSILIEPCLTCIGKWQKMLSPIILPLRQWQWTLEHQKSTLRFALTLKAIENQSNRRVHRLIVNITNRRVTCFPRWQYFMLIYIQMAWTSFCLNIYITARFLWLESTLISDICKSTFSLSITCITATGPMADLLQEKSPSEEGH